MPSSNELGDNIIYAVALFGFLLSIVLPALIVETIQKIKRKKR
jgi:hypothetical protein|tara:strand:+ start:1077 stop:1205 length:129 start_codon:yes stop_codon:yes gene_type:complete